MKPVSLYRSTVRSSTPGVSNATTKGVRLQGRPHQVRLALSVLALALTGLTAMPAWADGGAGGRGFGFWYVPGGSGFTGVPGVDSTSVGAGGGGGGAGGGSGGDSGVNGGSGGTVGSKNGQAGQDGAVSGGGGSGGGGGYNGSGSGTAAFLIASDSTLTGGSGGAGGNGATAGGGGGGGGAGGYGAVVTAGVVNSNAGAITGGAGGAGGVSGGYDLPDNPDTGGGGGSGGVGVWFSTPGATLTNSGTIKGGDGGVGGGFVSRGVAGAPGVGGAGIVGSGISITNSGTIAGGMSGDGITRADAIQFTGGTNSLALGSGSVINGNIGLSGGAGLEFNQSSDALLNNAITGAGSLIKTGVGALILNGVNTYTGGTTVNAGTLEVGDAATPGASIAGDVQVNLGGTLRGHGTVGGNVDNIGTVRPGGSIGTLTISGNYTQSSSGTLMIDVSPTAASQLKVGGTASLNGTLALLYGPGTYTPKTYRIVEANAVTGSFTSVTGATPSGVTQSVITGAKAVDLALTVAEISAVPVDPVTPVASVVVAPTNATLFGALGAAALREGQRVNGVLLDRLSRPCFSPNEQACVQPNGNVWILAGGTDTHIDGNNGAPDTRDQRYGFLAGADRQWKGWTVGLAAGYSHDDVTQNSAKGKLDTLRLAAYAGKRLGPVNIAGTLGYAYDFVSTTRSFGPFGNTKGSGHGQEFNAGIQASVPWAVGPVILSPHLGMRYAHVQGLALNETGPTSQNLGVDGQTLNSLQPYVGVTLDYPFQTSSERSGSFQARVGYAYETQSTGRNVAVTAADGTGFVVPGASDTRGMVTTGVGVTLPIGKATNAYVRYDALLHTGNVSAQSLQAGVNYRF